MRIRFRLATALVTLVALGGCASTPPLTAAARERAAAVDCQRRDCVDFIYVHGAATHSEDERQAMIDYVDSLHAALAARLQDTPEFVAGALAGGRLAIAPEPTLYFWGGEIGLVRDLETLELILESQEQREGRGPNKFFARNHRRLAEAIHDVMWAADDDRRYGLTDSLHATVRESRGAGRKVVLVGYSAGAVVAATYATYRIRGLRLAEFAGLLRGSEALPALFAGSPERTCGEALFESGLVEIDKTGLMQARLEAEADDGGIGLAAMREAFWADRLARLSELTERFCLDDDTLIGRIDFGSMVNLVASKTADAAGEMFVLSAREAVRRGQFMLNVNHADDLVGFNTYEEVRLFTRLEENLGLPPLDGPGFERSAEPKFTGANFINAHTWYIREPEDFSALVADTYARGYREMLARKAVNGTE